MADEHIRNVLARTGAADGPPLGVHLDDIVSRGGRIRRRRKLATIVGSASATAGVIVAVAFWLTPGPPEHVQPAAPPPPAPPAPIVIPQESMPVPPEPPSQAPTRTRTPEPTSTRQPPPPRARPDARTPSSAPTEPGLPPG
ncbi:hypothetical protein [Amycolatopsis suaedae]|uniref:Uncharacterized protein n=1 Tax=Amycolatopsis suaedae TaxID=2510978 RepID=A0A4Q7J9D5_9PSEU|nr:hypothetical protein [Amycolatopsis suaedae]RZQ64380.1 hypothetical protein EWH70_10480 [Amycolatopsis suaedae]